MSKPDLIASFKNISARDRTQIAKAQEMLGPDPSRMGFIKSIFWGNFREELVFPFPEVSPDETEPYPLVIELGAAFAPPDTIYGGARWAEQPLCHGTGFCSNGGFRGVRDRL